MNEENEWDHRISTGVNSISKYHFTQSSVTMQSEHFNTSLRTGSVMASKLTLPSYVR